MDPSATPSCGALRRLPRLRGDGPDTANSAQTQVRSPPPTRGWTRLGMTERGPGYVSPAYAGMDPSRVGIPQWSASLPRLRGDGPGMLESDSWTAPSPPPTRGWTLDGSSLDRWVTVSPAYAGMDPRRTRVVCRRGCLPRLRGDGPVLVCCEPLAPWSPPPTRGWTSTPRSAQSVWRVSPAYAGMDPVRHARRLSAIGLPRLRGDGPAMDAQAWDMIGSPPPTRGWTH